MNSVKFTSVVQDHKECNLLAQKHMLYIVRNNNNIFLSIEIPCFLVDFFCILIFWVFNKKISKNPK